MLTHKENGNSVYRQAPQEKTVPGQGPDGADPGNRLATWGGTILAVMSLVLILAVWSPREHRETSQSPTAAQRSEILIDEVEHLPPLASKAIPLSLPHGGIVNIDVQVVRGNPLDVLLTTSDQIDNVNKMNWDNLKIYGDIRATGTKTFRREVRLGQGGFFLVVRDMIVGMPSSPPSVISVKVRLNHE